MREIRVLWFEDEEDWQKSTEPLINKIILKYHSVLKVTPVTDVDDFFEKINNDASSDKFSNYDIIIVDYNLSSDFNGNQVIEKLSKYTIYGDIIFYSENSLDEIKSLLKDNIGVYFYESVYISARKNIKEKVAFIVEKIYHRTNDLAYARGNILDQSADIEFLIKEIGIKYFDQLGDKEKNLVLQDLETKVDVTHAKMLSNYDKTKKAIVNHDARKIFDSIFYIMTSEQKLDSVFKILENLNVNFEKSAEIRGFFKDLVNIRNNLAHKKIKISECGKYLMYFNNFSELVTNICDCSQHIDEGKISKEQYDKIIVQNLSMQDQLSNLIETRKKQQN